MKKICIALFWCAAIIVLNCSAVAGQKVVFKLFGEGNKNMVKLMWLPNYWPKDLTGFDIKRRVIKDHKAEAWQKLNGATIYPEMSVQKDLANVEPAAGERDRLKKKVQDMIARKQYKEVSNDAYLNKLKTDTAAIYQLYFPIAADYDFALINGFGLIDRAIPEAQEYEYGLFPHYNDKNTEMPAATYTWKYGSSPDIAIKTDFSYKSTSKNTRLQLIWKVSGETYNKLNINGFNIYRSGADGNFIKLNTNPVWLNKSEKEPQGAFFDDNLKENTTYTYAVAPLSVFGTEGIKTLLTYDVAKLPGDVRPPVLRMDSLKKNLVGMALQWDFDANSEKDVKGFIMARKMNKDSNYKAISNMLPANSRSFTDLKNLSNRQYYFYRLSAIRTDGVIIRSNELLLYYNPVLLPPKPAGLTGKYQKIKDINYIVLRWDKKNTSDTLSYGYHIYASFPPDKEISWKANIPLVKASSYNYEVFNSYGETYRFAIKAVNRYGDESPLSDTISVLSPSTVIPNVSIWPFTVDKNIITLNWAYEPIPDLKGFRLYQDGKLVLDENNLKANAQKWVSPPMDYGKTYKFEIEAVSQYGVISRRSIPVNITTDTRPKK